MKYTKILAAAVLTLAATNTFAASKTFYDTTFHWDGFGNGVDDFTNVVGKPDLATLTVTDLQSVDVSMSTPIPDDILFAEFSGIRDGLFINADGYGTDVTGWDYFIQGIYDGNSSTYKYNLYSIKSGITENDYTLSSDLTTLNNSQYRELHPVAIDSSFLTLMGDVTSFVDTTSTTSVLYDLLGMGVTLNSTYTISYVNSCANDVIVGATPIPGSALLFGSALFGIFGFKRFKNDAV